MDRCDRPIGGRRLDPHDGAAIRIKIPTKFRVATGAGRSQIHHTAGVGDPPGNIAVVLASVDE